MRPFLIGFALTAYLSYRFRTKQHAAVLTVPDVLEYRDWLDSLPTYTQGYPPRFGKTKGDTNE